MGRGEWRLGSGERGVGSGEWEWEWEWRRAASPLHAGHPVINVKVNVNSRVERLHGKAGLNGYCNDKDKK